MNPYVPNQLSFDDPVSIAVPEPEQLAANPLVEAIALFEDAKREVRKVADPFNQAEIDLIAVKRERDAAKKLLLEKQLDMDDVSRRKHDLEGKRNEAISTMNAIAEHLIDMGAKPWGNNQFVTPEQLAEWQRTGVSPFGESFSETPNANKMGSSTVVGVQ